MQNLFKYLSPLAARAVLQNRTLRWSRRSGFNDPFDLQVGYSTEIDAPAVRDRALDLMWHRIMHPGSQPITNVLGQLLEVMRVPFLVMGRETFTREMTPGIDGSLSRLPDIVAKFSVEVIEHFETLKVLCLSSINDSTTMWSHYAENHAGVVLEFATIDELDSVYRLAKPVQYTSKPPPILETEELARFLSGGLSLTPDLADRLMFIKSPEWQYENEWRLVTGEGRLPQDAVEYAGIATRELVGVYFGMRAGNLREELEPLVRARYPFAKLWQANKREPFGVRFDAIE